MPNLLYRLNNIIGDAALVRISINCFNERVNGVQSTSSSQHLELDDNITLYVLYDHEMLSFQQC